MIVMKDGKLENSDKQIFVRIPAIDRIGEVISINGRDQYQIDLYCRDEGEEHYVPIYNKWEIEEICEMEFLAEASRTCSRSSRSS